jgi:hypothetical protein
MRPFAIRSLMALRARDPFTWRRKITQLALVIVTH